LGFGGFCFPKDLQAFDFEILKAVERVNKQRIDRFLEKVHQALWVVKGKRVAILGLAFKANTDDVRFSPALEVARRILAEGADVHVDGRNLCSPQRIRDLDFEYFSFGRDLARTSRLEVRP
jgi:UDP-glucose 6-dehydrogenase